MGEAQYRDPWILGDFLGQMGSMASMAVWKIDYCTHYCASKTSVSYFLGEKSQQQKGLSISMESMITICHTHTVVNHGHKSLRVKVHWAPDSKHNASGFG